MDIGINIKGLFIIHDRVENLQGKNEIILPSLRVYFLI